jgi:hypothetical protein
MANASVTLALQAEPVREVSLFYFNRTLRPLELMHCDRTVMCPNACSAHGVCHTISKLGLYEGPDTDPGIGGDGNGPVYTNWDAESTAGCECDAGYFGPDCSQIMCPKGDDPETTGTVYCI